MLITLLMPINLDGSLLPDDLRPLALDNPLLEYVSYQAR